MRVHLIISLIIFYLIQPTSSSQIPEYLSRGIIFNEESNILVAEKFTDVKFLLPFHQYNFTSRNEIKEKLNY